MRVPVPAWKRRRGNPKWGQPLKPIPALLTEFEAEVARLRLEKSEYVFSVELKRWCKSNRNRVYVPEWLLDEWAMPVDTNWSAA
jgi:hypothetical protein